MKEMIVILLSSILTQNFAVSYTHLTLPTT